MTQPQATYTVDQCEIEDALQMLGKGYNSDPVSTEFISTMSGFTPAPDILIKEYGYVTALVWGRTWRFCQMQDGVCRAALEKLALSLGMSERTIIRHLDTLCEDGYLFDTTPDLRNKPHIYADTGKIKIRVNVEAGMTLSHRAMTESQREGDRESHEESIKKQVKKETTTGGKVFEVYQNNIALLTPKSREFLIEAEQEYPEDWIVEAITISVSNNKRNWKYCEAILKRWKADGKDDGKNKVTAALISSRNLNA